MKMIYKILVATCIFVISSISVCAQDYSTSLIADSLKRDAVAVLRDKTSLFSQKDVNNANYIETHVYTILNERGVGYGHFYLSTDKFHDLKRFSGVIYNSQGKVVKKIGKGDLRTSNFSGHLASDASTTYYECRYPTYPYTVEYTFELKYKNGILSYPWFRPLPGTRVGLERSQYVVEIPTSMTLRVQPNYECNMSDEIENNIHKYTFTANNLVPIISESFAPEFNKIAPVVRLAPSEFCFDSHCGDFSSWNSYGKWANNLLLGRDELPQTEIDKLKELTANASSDREKTKIVYEYMQSIMHYISIQLGIGGFQPIDATTTVSSKYGDCKGLSNVTKAMLKAVGIPSYYCEIYLGNKKQLKYDFPDASQTNHAILMVPFEKDSVWLECTNQKLPFGFVHSDIAGHDALVISDEGGQICKLPTYSENQNSQVNKVELTINTKGGAKGSVEICESLFGYESAMLAVTNNDRDLHVKYINRNLKMPKVAIGNIQTKEARSENPSCSISADIIAEDYANVTGKRLFLPICPINKGSFNLPSEENRKYDIDKKYGYSETDSITYHIPEGYVVERYLKPTILLNSFGTFISTFEQVSPTKLLYTQHLVMKAGIFDKEKYRELRSFYASLAGIFKSKIVLRKEN